MNPLKSDLIRKFAIYSLVAFTITGFGLFLIISRHITAYAINAKIEMVEFALSNAAMMATTEAQQISASVSPSEGYSLPHLFSHLNAIGVSDYIVQDETGKLVSQMQADAIDAETLSILLQTNTDGDAGIGYEIIKTASKDEKLLKISSPYQNDVTHEKFNVTVIFPYEKIEGHQNMLIQNIILVISGGLLLLYLLLVRVMMNASKTLIRQKDSLDIKNQEIEQAYEQLNISFHSTVQALADAVDARDPYTAGHVTRVMTYTLGIGRAMKFDQAALNRLMLAAQMHDIGKIGISDAVLLKPEKLTEVEYELIKTHPDIGVSILKNIPDFSDILPAVRHHHERFDGRGYPLGLADFDIPLEARIIAVADAYDAMTTNRPYRNALNDLTALRELLRNCGTQFDPEIAEIFIRTLEVSCDDELSSSVMIEPAQ